MYGILINILIFCGIILFIALAIAVILGIFILLDVKRISREVRKKFLAVTSVIDIVSLLFGGVEGAKERLKKRLSPNKSSMVAFIAGLKKGLEVLTKK